MKSLFLILFSVALLYLTSLSQENNWEWSIQSVSAGNNYADNLAIDNQNNYYFSGFYDPGYFQIGDSVFFCQDAATNSFVSGFDRDGNFRWAVSFQKLPEGPYGMVMDCQLAVDSEQNLYVAGEFDFSVVLGDTVLESYGNWDVFIAKYDSSGQFIWAYQVGGPTDDQVSDIKIDDYDNLYFSLNHSRPSFNNTVVYGNNDTTISFHNYCASVLSLTADASITWLTFGISEDDVEAENLILDIYDNLYAEYMIFGDFLINGHTIEADIEPITHLLIPFGLHGAPVEYEKFPHYWSLDMLIDGDGNFLLTGAFNSPMIILGDTLVPVGFYDFLLVKYNHQMEPVWYITFPNNSSMIDFKMDIDWEDDIYISAPFTGELTIGDTTIVSESADDIFIAKLDPTGDFSSAVTIQGNAFQYCSALNLDHCGNIIYCGGYNGEIYLGSDTLSAGSSTEVLLAKLSNEIGFLDLGSDKVACGSLVLSAPEGCPYYSWNDGMSYEDHLTVTETGFYSLQVINAFHCSDMDTVFVEIRPVPQADLGNDTLIFISGSLYFAVDPQADFILWSDGSTGSEFEFNAADFGAGYHTVWVRLEENECYNADSIIIHVIDNSSIAEQAQIVDLLYPNPASEALQISCKSGEVPEAVVFYNQVGVKVLNLHPLNNSLDIRGLKSGVYIVELVFKKNTLIRRLIII